MKNILLLGYGEMGSYVIERLSKKFNILGVVIPPRSTRFLISAVLKTKQIASRKGIALFEDGGLEKLCYLVEKLSPEAVVICSYDKIIPPKILNLSKFISVHHGDLPRYRGRANLNWAIINGRSSIGLTIHEAVQDLDSGRIYKSWKILIKPSGYISDLYGKVNDKILNNLPHLVEKIIKGTIKPYPQRGDPTYCCTRLPEDSRINWSDSAENIRNLIRGISKPFSGALTTLYYNGKMSDLVIWRADIPDEPRTYEGKIPGRIGRVLKGTGVEVLTGSNPLIVTYVNYKGQEFRADQVIKSTAATLR